MADDNDLPRSPTHHNHDPDHDHDHEISAALALDNVNTSRDSSYNNANLGESLSSNSSSSGRAGTGHERGFVQPASYLRRRGISHPMAPSKPERAVDAEEQMGLVSRSCSIWCYDGFGYCAFLFPCLCDLFAGFVGAIQLQADVIRLPIQLPALVMPTSSSGLTQ